MLFYFYTYQIWRELDSLLSADELVKSNETCDSSQTNNNLGDSLSKSVEVHRNWPYHHEQQACDAPYSYVQNSHAERHPLFQYITVRYFHTM